MNINLHNKLSYFNILKVMSYLLQFKSGIFAKESLLRKKMKKKPIKLEFLVIKKCLNGCIKLKIYNLRGLIQMNNKIYSQNFNFTTHRML